MTVTCLHVSLMIHCYAFAEPIPNYGAPAVKEYLQQLLDWELIAPTSESTSGFKATPKGCYWINMLLSTPMPALKYVDPRFEVK